MDPGKPEIVSHISRSFHFFVFRFGVFPFPRRYYTSKILIKLMLAVFRRSDLIQLVVFAFQRIFAVF